MFKNQQIHRRQLLAAPLALAAGGCPRTVSADTWRLRRLLHADDFQNGLDRWRPELERGGTVAALHGALDIDVPGGATVWFTPCLIGPIAINYSATLISAGGSNDRVSDLNCFWMATDPRAPQDIFAARRSGAFADYDVLRAYYVGQGGNSNTTTRFRRYVGRAGDRPLLPENDHTSPLLLPNRNLMLSLIAFNGLIQYYCDGVALFSYQDAEPYRSGWFGLRTTQNHMRVQHFRVYALDRS